MERTGAKVPLANSRIHDGIGYQLKNRGEKTSDSPRVNKSSRVFARGTRGISACSGEFSRIQPSWTQPLLNKRLLLAGSPVAAGRFRNYNGLWKGGPGVVGWLRRGSGGRGNLPPCNPLKDL